MGGSAPILGTRLPAVTQRRETMLAGVPARDRADDLAANSTLIDKGTNVGLPYRRNAPDLGAFESS